MSELTAALSHKLGPLPMGAWALAVGGGLGAAVLIRNHAANTATAAAPDTTAGLATTAGLGGAAVSDPANPGAISDPAGDPAAPATAAPVNTNSQWRQQAVKYLIAQGHSGVYAEYVIGRYLSGKTISHYGGTLLDKVLAGLGPTPQAVPPPVVKPAPKPKPKPKPAPKPKPKPPTHHQGKPPTHPTHPKPHHPAKPPTKHPHGPAHVAHHHTPAHKPLHRRDTGTS